MSAGAAGTRPATHADAWALTMLERAANLPALGHIFPPDQFAYPTEDVHRRWKTLLADPDVRVLVAEDATGLAAFVAFDADLIRHLAVRPDLWGTGLARRMLSSAVTESRARRLWCLERNTQALGMYAHMGWTPTGRRRQAEFPPRPDEIELHLAPGAT